MYIYIHTDIYEREKIDCYGGSVQEDYGEAGEEKRQRVNTIEIHRICV
jgi:hypothetical protein